MALIGQDESAGVPTARLFATGIAVMLAVLALMLAIPHDPYVRWQMTTTEAFARLGWVYERAHFDPTPVDVALIGTSHTMNGVDGLAVAKHLGEMGVRTADGRCPTVTNFAIPAYGRNMSWAVAREVLTTRKPGLLVLEVMENETRKPHPLFYRVATTGDLVRAPALFNTDYLLDLLRLPYRQVMAGIETLAPAEFGLKARWSPADYDGSTVDNTRVINVGGRALTPPWTRVTPEARLRAEGAAAMRNKDLHMLPRALAPYEYAVPDRYVPDILNLARRQDVPVLLLYLPGYGRPPAPLDMRLYGGTPIVSMNDILARTDIWHDVDHLNASGAALASERLASLLAPRFLRAAGQSTGPACDWGFGARVSLRPFRKAGS
jgi:hypothetical protein